MRCRPEQDLAFGERFPHKPELVVLEVAQPAVDQLAAGRGGGTAEIALLAKRYGEPAPRRVTGDADPVYAAAYNK
jgi:hypothetical protein